MADANGIANSFLGEALDSLIEKDFKEDYAVGRRVSGLKGKAGAVQGRLGSHTTFDMIIVTIILTFGLVWTNKLSQLLIHGRSESLT